MASNMFLYWGSGSVPCWRPMIVLEEKGLQGYGNKMISFSNKEHKGEDVTKLNSRGQVPTFKDGDVVVNESSAICDYLEYKFADQGTCLLPKDAAERGKVLQKVHEAQNISRTLIEGVLYYIFTTKKEDMSQEVLDTRKKAAREELDRWETYMKAQGEGSYVVGSTFTMADVHVFPLLAFGVRSSLNMDSFPALNAYYKKVVGRPSIKASWPPHWNEEPGKDFFVGI